MKEKQEYFNYVWVCAEIGKIKREIREYERLLELLEGNKKLYEMKLKRGKKK